MSSFALSLPSVTGSLDSYIQAVNTFPILTPAQEVEYARRYRKDAAKNVVLPAHGPERKPDPIFYLAGGNIQPENQELSSVNYIDLALNFRVGDHYNFRLGVNNILDKDPPLSGATNCPAGPCNGNTWAQVYDALGRYIFAGVTLDF